MQTTSKSPTESMTILEELIMHNDTNPIGTLMGGKLLYWMDMAAGIAAMKHSGYVVVTAAVDQVAFKEPIQLGQIAKIVAQVTCVFTSSMEVMVRVYAQDYSNQKSLLANEAFFTMVALDAQHKTTPVIALTPTSEEEKNLQEAAIFRKEQRLKLRQQSIS